MKFSLLLFSLLVFVVAFVVSGCSGKPAAPGAPESSTKDKTDHHADGHVPADHDHADAHSHEDHSLTDKDVKMPATFNEGLTRLSEPHGKIDHLIEHGELGDVHRVAEEIALVAKQMKELARKDLPEDKQTEAGRLCNELAGYFKPIDAAGDAGNKAETQAIHEKMGTAIEKLKSLAK